MKIYYLIYATDAWHTDSSKTLIGFYTDTRRIIPCINRYITKEHLQPLEEEYQDVTSLIAYKQTQGRYNNFQIDTLNANTDLF